MTLVRNDPAVLGALVEALRRFRTESQEGRSRIATELGTTLPLHWEDSRAVAFREELSARIDTLGRILDDGFEPMERRLAHLKSLLELYLETGGGSGAPAAPGGSGGNGALDPADLPGGKEAPAPLLLALLVERLRSATQETAALVSRLLSRLPAEETAGSLSPLVTDPDPALRTRAAETLGLVAVALGTDRGDLFGSRAEEPLAPEGVKGPPSAARSTPQAPPHSIEPLLRPLQNDPSAMVRISAVRALGNVEAPWAVSLLWDSTRDPLAEVRAVAAAGLARAAASGRLDAGALRVDRLGALASDADEDTRLSVAAASWSLADARLLPVLERLAGDPSPSVRVVAQAGRAALSGASVAAATRPWLEHPHPSTRRLAAEALARHVTPEVVPGLASALRDPEEGVRRAAAVALAGAATSAAGAALSEAFARRPDATLFRALMKAPGETGWLPGLTSSPEPTARWAGQCLAALRAHGAGRPAEQLRWSSAALATQAATTGGPFALLPRWLRLDAEARLGRVDAVRRSLGEIDTQIERDPPDPAAASVYRAARKCYAQYGTGGELLGWPRGLLELIIQLFLLALKVHAGWTGVVVDIVAKLVEDALAAAFRWTFRRPGVPGAEPT